MSEAATDQTRKAEADAVAALQAATQRLEDARSWSGYAENAEDAARQHAAALNAARREYRRAWSKLDAICAAKWADE